LLSQSGRGRPRKRCEACAADKAALGRLWREANPERVAEHNERRRKRRWNVYTQRFEDE
jgi:hypothetical protein